MILAVLFANSAGNVLIERFNGVPAEERLHWRTFLVKLGAENLKGVKNEELLVACHKSVYIVYTMLGDVSIFLVGKDEYDELACNFSWEMKENAGNPLHLTSLNHVSLLCRSIEESMNFYHKVLGFIPIRRPESLNFDGAWLFGHGIGIHLLRSPEPEKLPKKTAINPKDNHISFQCESMGAVEKMLEEMEIEYVRAIVEEGGIQVDQLFFHDPDGFMIEICNCDSLPVVPIVGDMARSCSRVKLHQMVQPQPQTQIHQVVRP